MFPNTVNLGGTSPRARRSRTRLNPVYKIDEEGQPQLVSGPVAHAGYTWPGGSGWWGGGGGWWGGGWPYYGIRRPYYAPAVGYYPYAYPYSYSPSYYGYGSGYTYPTQTYSETVPSSCCYNVETGTLYCPGSQYDGAPAYAEATRQYQGRNMSFVTSPKLGQAQWFWNCPSQSEPSAVAGLSVRMPRYPNRPGPRRSRLR